MTTSTKTFSIVSATEQRVAALLSLAVTVAMLAANVGLVERYTGQAAPAAAVVVHVAPATSTVAKG